MRNKVVKKILVIFILMMTFFQNVISVNAFTVTDKLKIDQVVDLGYIKDAYVYMRTTTTGEYLYCLQANRGNPSTTVTLEGQVKDDGIIYLIKNGFPNVKMTGDDKKDYYITQLAIWWYKEDIHGVKSNKLDDIKAGKYDDNEIVVHLKKLYNGAVNAYKNGIPEPSLKVNDKNTLSLSSDGKYLISDLMKVNLTSASKYKVSILNNEDALVVDKNGNEKNSFKANETFRIKVKNNDITELSVDVKVEADGVVDEVYSYKPALEWQQKVSVGALVSTIVPLSKKINFNYKVNKVDVEFSKIDVTTGKELPGAHLEIKNSNNEVVESWVSTNETHFFKLLPGKYTLTETIAPEGYELSTETIEFEVKENGSVTKIVMENKPVKKDSFVEVSKIDVTTGKELPGAHLEIKDNNGKVVAEWVSTDKPKTIKLEPGKYTLTETIAPEGYELSTETIEFEVKENGVTTKVVMENKPFKDSYVEVSKIDVTTGKELPGAHLEIKDNNGKVVVEWVSTDKPKTIKLEPGKYTLTETIAPEGYELSTETIEFEVKENGVTTKVVMENKPVKKEVKVEFSKIDVTTGKELPGAHLEIRDNNNNLIESWVSTNETHFFELLPGVYTLTEIISPEGYELSTESITFEVKEDGSLTKVVMENKPVKKVIKVEFSKIDVSTGKELPGAYLELKDINGNLIESWVSTNETHFIELLPGKYTLTETIAPEGYELSTETIEFEVKEDGSVTKIVMENKPYIEVPITDLNASSTILLLGSLMLGLGLIVVYSYVKKERVQK